MPYRPRAAPSRFRVGMPAIVQTHILDIFGPFEDAVCEYEVLFKPSRPNNPEEIEGLDFDADGGRGCTFGLNPWQARRYRERFRRRRVAWSDLPEATRVRIATELRMWTEV